MNRAKNILYVVPAFLILIACERKQETRSEVESSLIEITSQQFNAEGMQIGEAERRIFENTVRCNGIFVPLPNGVASVSAPVAGIVKNTYIHQGQYVKKNQLLIEVAGNEIIDIQKSLTEASANYKRLKNEYDRVKTLYNENVTTEKNFIIAESEYQTAMAEYQGLKLKLEAIGLSASKIENGEFYSSYSIKSPINGQISNLNARIGSYLDPHAGLIEIIDPAMLQIQLSLFPDDIEKIKKGQNLRYTAVHANATGQATITSVGMAINNDTKSIPCYARITDQEPVIPIANQFIESEIITSVDTVYAVPSDAILKSETGNKILILEKQEGDRYFFNVSDVAIGGQNNGFTEISGDRIHGKILIKGVYNISV